MTDQHIWGSLVGTKTITGQPLGNTGSVCPAECKLSWAFGVHWPLSFCKGLDDLQLEMESPLEALSLALRRSSPQPQLRQSLERMCSLTRRKQMDKGRSPLPIETQCGFKPTPREQRSKVLVLIG